MAQGEEDALAAFYALTSRQVYTLALRILRDHQLADEATVDVYLKAWGRAQSFDPARGGPRVWLMTIARTRAIDRLRREIAAASYDPELADQGLPRFPECSGSLEYERVHTALAALPAAQRHALELAYFQGLSQPEIADRLGEPLGTIKTRTRLALQRMRMLLRQEYDR